MALEARPGDDGILHALFRDAHTVKGGAALVGFDGPRDLAHDLEGCSSGSASAGSRSRRRS